MSNSLQFENLVKDCNMSRIQYQYLWSFVPCGIYFISQIIILQTRQQTHIMSVYPDMVYILLAASMQGSIPWRIHDWTVTLLTDLG